MYFNVQIVCYSDNLPIFKVTFSHGEMPWHVRTPLISARENTSDLKLLRIL